MTAFAGVVDHVEGLTHIAYDDARTRCGLWFTLYNRNDHKIEHVWDAVPTCVVCAGWQPQPRDRPLWRTW